ncbi:MAG TPA: DUF3465 domain-containing protein [Pseudomonadales bacterium]
MRKVLLSIVFVGGALLALQRGGLDGWLPALSGPAGDADAVLADAFERRVGSLQVEGAGEVVRLLPDDRDGSRHQRFVLRLDSGQTVLVAHNIDLAPRVSGLREGDRVAFFGEYEWNERGGVIHWTHRDPQGRHVAGWLKHAGRTYQ